MTTNNKFLLTSLILIVIAGLLYIFLNQNSTTNKTIQKKNITKKEETLNILNNNENIKSQSNSKEINYKTTFKETKKTDSTLKKLNLEKEQKEIELNSKELIQQAEELITEHNLAQPSTSSKPNQNEQLNIRMKTLKEKIEKSQK